MPAKSIRQRLFLIFGGQGSPSVFSSNTAATAENDARSASVGSILLSRCHAAFLQELVSLDDRTKRYLAIDPTLFPEPHDLLSPATKFHSHPVLQATTIYICQLLHYLAEIQDVGHLFEDSFDLLHETAGFSSGLLPATVVARSRTLDEFLAAGVEVFRLAFWIACRSTLLRINHNISEPLDVAESGATASLVIRSVSHMQIESRLSTHYSTQKAYQDSETDEQSSHFQSDDEGTARPAPRLQISAVSNSNVISVSGPSSELNEFRLKAVPDLATTFAYVHGWYHGGEQLESVVDEVLEDLQRRKVTLPSCSSSAKPIRSTLDGTLFDTSNLDSLQIFSWLARHLLVHRVNWSDTTLQIAASSRKLLEDEPASIVKLLAFGPSSGNLFPQFGIMDPRIELLDLSPFGVKRKSSLSRDYQDSIAIVGLSVNLPAGKGTEQLWQTLSEGLNTVQVIPESRFRVSDYYSKGDSGGSRSMSINHGAFVDNPFSFDHSFFNVSPREARSMDPQQRILLHGAQEALEDAGYVADSSQTFQRASMGCYVGLATGDYTDNLSEDIDVFYSPGTLRAFHSGRISYFYKLSGPSIVTDTACSSSMVSVYQACRALQSGDCTAAIAGGVNIISSPDMYLGLARGHFLSPTGGCKPFDEAADGYCRAEGCVLFVLKRLSDAIAENDNIHGVIRNVMINQSGNSHSITHPHSQTQIDLFNQLLQQTKVDPGSISVVESHGTGTQAGDTCEIESLRSIFEQHHSTDNPLFISSIKGNIGHSEAASGAAGLAKLLLMLRAEEIPAQAGLKNINPLFKNLESSGIIIPRKNTKWKQSKESPRRAMLNNFGAAGSNTSLLLEEWVQPPDTQVGHKERSAYIFTLSAKSAGALQATREQYLERLGKPKARPSLKDICYTATARRQIYDHRLSVVCSSVDDLTSKLERYKIVNSAPAQDISQTVFVFSGQGALYLGMGQELMYTFPFFKQLIVTCDDIVRGLGYPSILDAIQNTSDILNKVDDAVNLIALHCACVALEYSLAKIFISWGVIPQYVMGHSLGEYAALCISGALSLEDTLTVVATRAKLITDHCRANATGMLACKLTPETAEQMISDNPQLTKLTVTCLNSLDDCVVGGSLDQLDVFKKQCQTTQSIKVKLLDVPYAFHSPTMDPIVEPLHKLGASIKFEDPSIPIFSNVFGRLFEKEDFSSRYFALHARQPVRFAECLQNLQSREVLDRTVFIEVGPHITTLPMVRSTIMSNSCHYLGTLRYGQDAWNSLSTTLAAISLLRIPVEWREVFSGTQAKAISLPGHLLNGSTYVVPYKECRNAIDTVPKTSPDTRTITGFKLLPWLNKEKSSSQKFTLETTLKELESLISGHDVGGTSICPASLFHELALEGAQSVLGGCDGQIYVVEAMNFASPLIYHAENGDHIVTVIITKHDSASIADFKIISFSDKDVAEKSHCSGTICLQTFQAVSSRWSKDKALIKRQRNHFSGIGKDYMSTFRRKVLYETVFTRVVRYSQQYQSLAYLDVADSNLEGIGTFKMPSNNQTGFIAPPIFTDTLLHAAGFIANLAVRSDEVAICSRVQSVEINYPDINYTDHFTIYCSLLEVTGTILADAIVSDASEKVVAVIRGMEFKRLRLHNFQHMLALQSANVEHPEKKYEQPKPPLSTGLSTPSTVSEVRDINIESGNTLNNNVRATLNNIVMECGGFSEKDMDYSKTLNELGIDSLMQIEIISKLTRMFFGHAGLSHHALSECESLESLETTLLSILQSMVATSSTATNTQNSSSEVSDKVNLAVQNHTSTNVMSNNPVTLRIANENNSPLYLFHDGSGQVTQYARLQNHDRSTYAFFDPHFGNDDHLYRSINEMVKLYISQVAESRTRSLILGGWSFGGVVAFEAAHQLMALGYDVIGLILIDAPSPIDHRPLPKEIISSVIKSSNSTPEANNPSQIWKEFDRNATLLGSYDPSPFSKSRGSGLKTVYLRSQEVLDAVELCGVTYDWLSNQDVRSDAIKAWEGLVGDHVQVLSIPGNHFEAFTPKNIGKIGAQLWKACRYIEG